VGPKVGEVFGVLLDEELDGVEGLGLDLEGVVDFQFAEQKGPDGADF
jgi:hypothetical protein